MSDYELPVLPVPAGEWALRARCRGMDPRVFFPERGSRDWATALATCADCEVRTDCLTWACKIGFRDGIFGGTTPRQRRGSSRVRLCRVCDTRFEVYSPTGGPGTPFCSERCRASARAERKRLSRPA